MGGVLHGAGGRKKERMFEEPIDSVGAGVSRFKRFRFTPFSIVGLATNGLRGPYYSIIRSIKVDFFHSLSTFSSIQLSQLQFKTGGEMAYRIPAGKLRKLIVGKEGQLGEMPIEF